MAPGSFSESRRALAVAEAQRSCRRQLTASAAEQLLTRFGSACCFVLCCRCARRRMSPCIQVMQSSHACVVIHTGIIWCLITGLRVRLRFDEGRLRCSTCFKHFQQQRRRAALQRRIPTLGIHAAIFAQFPVIDSSSCTFDHNGSLKLQSLAAFKTLDVRAGLSQRARCAVFGRLCQVRPQRVETDSLQADATSKQNPATMSAAWRGMRRGHKLLRRRNCTPSCRTCRQLRLRHLPSGNAGRCNIRALGAQ